MIGALLRFVFYVALAICSGWYAAWMWASTTVIPDRACAVVLDIVAIIATLRAIKTVFK